MMREEQLYSISIMSEGPHTATEDNKALVRRYYEEFYDRRNLAVIDELVSEKYVHHIPDVLNQVMDYQDFRKRELQMSGAFPDLSRSIEDMIAEGDKVVTRSIMKGTHTGNLPNIPATDRKIDVDCIVINRINDGKIVEGWESYDSLGMYLQLEVIHMVSTLSKARHERGAFPPLRTWPE
ncbi:ester cyclase [Methanocella arvoryzae]|uniref:Ester cyclase n=1 Tax=Methanocella arvoryzae (strain DSM 22066 / NBRC 105507 / MRE50) TaxID=351160 RepID=Q0W0Z9_METAR|nr:ester cyclase [Methanocella arvoryzae]CAJ37944.1 conserved hypothetical protein [Methanocella arvoryzae MRE50]